MKAPWYMRGFREHREDGHLVVSFRPHSLWVAWVAAKVIASHLWRSVRGPS